MTPKLRILLVDDDRRMTRTLSDILCLGGYEVVTACSGEDALEKVGSEPFDCVLSDVCMPGIDGLELHRRLRQQQPVLPLVLMTAYAASAVIHQGLAEGVVGVLDKPLDLNHLLGFFASLTKNRTIVIVDDDADFCTVIGSILKQRGFNIEQFSDPDSEVKQFVSTAQIILLDMHFGSRDGLEMPVVLVTGYRQEMAASIQAALEINAHTCLYKPLEIPTLLQTLAQLKLGQLRKMFNSGQTQ
jgi:two-component system, NtrC family, response regulator HydG